MEMIINKTQVNFLKVKEKVIIKWQETNPASKILQLMDT
jgi:hypothetical protein